MDTDRLAQWIADEDQSWENLAWLLGDDYKPERAWEQGLALLSIATDLARGQQGVEAVRVIFDLSESKSAGVAELSAVREEIDVLVPPKLVRLYKDEAATHPPPRVVRDPLTLPSDEDLPNGSMIELTTDDDPASVRRSLMVTCPVTGFGAKLGN